MSRRLVHKIWRASQSQIKALLSVYNAKCQTDKPFHSARYKCDVNMVKKNQTPAVAVCGRWSIAGFLNPDVSCGFMETLASFLLSAVLGLSMSTLSLACRISTLLPSLPLGISGMVSAANSPRLLPRLPSFFISPRKSRDFLLTPRSTLR